MPFAVGKVLKDDTINAIADKHGVTAAEVVVAWELAHGLVTIPSSTKRKNLEINFNALSLTLDAEDIAKIDALDSSDRQAAPDFSPQWD
jgi:2,5-diketo-D-gluconate reductase B